MTGLQYAPGITYVSGGGRALSHWAGGLILTYVVALGVYLIPAAVRAHRRGMARVRRYNQRHAPRHARRVE